MQLQLGRLSLTRRPQRSCRTSASTAVLTPALRNVTQQWGTYVRQLCTCPPAQFSSFLGSKMLQLACIIPVSSCNTASGLKRKPVTMSFLGVGAPEAVLVGIVALVVFGPKGLAEAAKSVGKTLRSFQPTIKEIAEVTQDLKGTLEKELGLDEIRSAARPPPRPMPTTYEDLPVAEGPEAGIVPARLQAATEELARQADPDIEAKRAMSADMAWGGGAAQQPAQQSTAAAGPRAAAAGKDLASMSVEDLEAELARRRSNATAEKQRT